MLLHNREQNENTIDNHTNGRAFNFSTNNDTFRLILGILSVIIGLFKLLSPVQGDVPVIGDLIPAVSGFAGGAILIFEYYRKLATIELNQYALLELILAHNKKRIGFLAMGSAVLHFLFPQALLI